MSKSIILALVVVSMSLAVPAQSFGALQSYPSTSTSTAAIAEFALGDLNGDGAVDLVGADVAGLVVLLGSGSGVFGAATRYPVGLLTTSVALADVSGDGKLDVLVGSLSGVALMLGNGGGGLGVPGSLGGGAEVAVADLNGDARPDVLTTSGGTFAWLQGNGTGGFGSVVQVSTTTGMVGKVAVGDLDGDGDADVVGRDLLGAHLVVLHNAGGGGFSASSLILPVPVASVCLGDINEDGALDLVAPSLSGLTVELLLNDGKGSFLAQASLPGSAANRAAVFDVDGDRHADVVIGDAGSIVVFRGNGLGALSKSAVFAAGPLGAVVPGDLNADGFVDMVVGGALAWQVGVLMNQTLVPSGVVTFGLGTPACAGAMGMTALPRPSIGVSDFRILCTNAPPRSSGLILLGYPSAGTDPLSLGITFFVDLGGSWLMYDQINSDSAGVGSYPLAIAANPGLVGCQAWVQSVWIASAGMGNSCSPGFGEIATSRGLEVTVQP